MTHPPTHPITPPTFFSSPSINRLGTNWSRTLTEVVSKRGVALSDLSISDWTQDELDTLYHHWNVECPSMEALKQHWHKGR